VTWMQTGLTGRDCYPIRKNNDIVTQHKIQSEELSRRQAGVVAPSYEWRSAISALVVIFSSFFNAPCPFFCLFIRRGLSLAKLLFCLLFFGLRMVPGVGYGCIRRLFAVRSVCAFCYS
jgi:hypothetical protein